MKTLKITSATALFVALAACGAGNLIGSAVPISGTAAVGAPMANAVVTLKDTAGTTLTATADANGDFQFKDVSTLKAPFILKAVAIVGGEEKSLFSALDQKPAAGATAVINVTPLTNAIVAQLAPAGDVSALFATPSGLATAVTPAKVSDATGKAVKVVEDILTQLNIDPTKFNPIKDSFKADSTGKDKLFDLVKFQPTASGDIEITDKASGLTKTVAKADDIAAVAIKKLPAIPSNILSFDFSKLKDMLAALKTKAGFAASVDDNFLDRGMNKTTFLNEIDPYFSYFSIVDYVVGSCDAVTSVCNGTMTIRNQGEAGETWIDQEKFPVKFSGGTWKLYGNQSPIAFNLRQVIQISTAATTRPTYSELSAANGFRVGLQLDVKNPSGATDTVDAYFCTFTKTNCETQPFISLVGKSGGNYYVNPNDLSSNFKETLPSAGLEIIKQKYLEGQLWVKVVKGGQSYTFKPDFKFLTPEDKQAIVERALKAVNFNEINTTAFTPAKRLEYVSASVASSISGGGELKLNEDILAAAINDGQITVSEACAAQNPVPASCNVSGAKFTYIFQIFKDEFFPFYIWFSANRP